MTRPLLLAFAVIAISSAPAMAAPYMAEAANWTVYAMSNSCAAFNRLPAEWNMSPWNSMTVTAPKAGGYLIGAEFWPGVLEDGKNYHLKLHVEGRKAHDIDAIYGPGIGLRSVDPVPQDIIDELTGAEMVSVGATGVTVQLGFDMTHLKDVLGLLEECRKTLAQ